MAANTHDDSPRFKLLNCKLCGHSFEDHIKSNGGLVTRPLDNPFITLQDFTVKYIDKCIASPWVDFERERIFPQA